MTAVWLAERAGLPFDTQPRNGNNVKGSSRVIGKNRIVCTALEVLPEQVVQIVSIRCQGWDVGLVK